MSSEILDHFAKDVSLFDQSETAVCEGCDMPFEHFNKPATVSGSKLEQEIAGAILCPKCAKKAAKKGINFVKKKDLGWQKSVTYRLVDTVEKFKSFLKDLSELPKEHPVGIDTETTGLFPREDKIVGISVSWKEGDGYYIPIRHDLGNNLDPITTLNAIADQFPHHFWVLANAKFDMEMFYMETGKTLTPGSDIIVLHSLDDSTIKFGRSKRGLKAATKKFYGIEMLELEDMIGSGKTRIPVASVRPIDMLMYATADADFTRRLHFTIMEKMKRENNPALNILLELEMRLIPVLMEMEIRGVAVDLEYFNKIKGLVEKRLENALKNFYELAKTTPEELDVNSSKQLSKHLYQTLGIPEFIDPKTGSVTTGKLAVEHLQKEYPVMAALEKVRGYQKLHKDFICKAITDSRDGIMYFSLNQIGETKSGRMSSSKISEDLGLNMQQIPNKGEDDVKVRKGFKARDGYILGDVDFSQIELRVFASESGSKAMLDSIAAGYDLHTATASAVFNVSVEKVTSDQRKQAKGVNFTLTFGGSHYTIALKNGISEREALQQFNAFFARNPEAKKWMEASQQFALKNGYIETRFGRRILIPEIKSSNHKERGYGFRRALNSPIQGTAVDIFKISVLKVYSLIKEIREQYGQDAIFMLLFVHDEILFEIRKDLNVSEIMARIRNAMELKIPGYCRIKVDQEVGLNWHDLEKVGDDGSVPVVQAVEAKAQAPDKMEEVVEQPKEVILPSKLFLSLENQLAQKALDDLKLLFNEYIGVLPVVVDFNGETLQSPFMVSESIVPELRRMLPRAIIQLRDKDNNPVNPRVDAALFA